MSPCRLYDSIVSVKLTQNHMVNSKNPNANTMLFCKCSPAPALLAALDPNMPSSLNKYVYAVSPKRNARRAGTVASQYCMLVSSFRFAAVRSEMPKKASRTPMNAVASLGFSREVAWFCFDVSARWTNS